MQHKKAALHAAVVRASGGHSQTADMGMSLFAHLPSEDVWFLGSLWMPVVV